MKEWKDDKALFALIICNSRGIRRRISDWRRRSGDYQ